MAKESLKLAPSETEQKPSKEHFEGGDKCVYPSEVSVMELRKSKKGPKSHACAHTRTYTQKAVWVGEICHVHTLCRSSL